MIEASWPVGQPAPRPGRPWSVLLALVLLLVSALFMLLTVVYFVDELRRIDGLVDRAAQATGASSEEADSARTAVKALDGIGIVAAVLTAGVLTGLSLWFSRGSHVARVLAVVMAGAITLCCCGCFGLTAYLGSRPATDESEFSAELTRLQGEDPSPLLLVLLAAALLVPACTTAAFVMLVLPPSNRYFRPAPAAPSSSDWSTYYAYPDASYWSGPAPAPQEPTVQEPTVQEPAPETRRTEEPPPP